MPPRDSDGIGTGSDGELVAQIIPLRRREREPGFPEILADEPLGPQGEPQHPPPVERSVWDPPVAELRRRAPDTTQPHPERTVGLPRRGDVRARWLAGVTAAATAGAIATTMLLTLGGGAGPVALPSHPQKYAASQLGPRRGAAKLTARASPAARSAATAHRVTDSQRAPARTGGMTPRRAATSAAQSAYQEPAVSSEQTATEQTTTTTTSQSAAQSAPPTQYTDVSTPSSESNSSQREFGFER